MGQLRIPPLVMYLVIPGLVVIGILSALNLIPKQVTATLFGSQDSQKDIGLKVYLKTVNDFSQIAMKGDSEEIVLTNDRFNNVDVFTRGEYIVWIRELPEENQVVRYHIPSRQDLTVASSGIFEHPRVDEKGNVTWQRWRTEDNQWYISYYDGTEKKLSRQGRSPDINGQLLMYARRTEKNDWELVQVDLENNTEQSLITDPSVKQALYDDDAIHFPGGVVNSETTSLSSQSQTSADESIAQEPFVETVENPPDRQEGDPSEVPPGDERLFNGTSEDEENDQID